MGILGRLQRDECGAMAIETVVVAPVLALMALGTFQVGTMVSRQQELQSAASEAEGIILAAARGTGTDSSLIEGVIETSLGLSSDKVSLEQRFRCNTDATLVTDASTCGTERIYQYVLLRVTDTYTPIWAQFGVGSPHSYDITRTIQIQ